MRKLILALAALSTVIFSQYSYAESPLSPITNLFDAMRAHDGEKLLAQFTESAILQRATNNQVIKTSEINKFATSITKSTKYLDEHLLSNAIQESGNLATVWTPYAFYLDGKLSHCGVNSFQLVKINKIWKIHYLIDNTYEGSCEDFITKHKKTSS